MNGDETAENSRKFEKITENRNKIAPLASPVFLCLKHKFPRDRFSSSFFAERT